jgi:hypothetical protein
MTMGNDLTTNNCDATPALTPRLTPDDLERFLSELVDACGDKSLAERARGLFVAAPGAYTAESLLIETMKVEQSAAVKQAGASLMERCVR